jgi:hypothetical protein
MISYPRAEIATVKIGHLEFEGLMLHDGTFGIAVPQLAQIFPYFQDFQNQASKMLKRLMGEGFKTTRVKTEFNRNATLMIDLPSFLAVVKVLTKKSDVVAQELAEQLMGLSLQQLFSDAFCIQFEKEERQQWLKDRQDGKENRRTLTDSIKDYLLSYPHADKNLYALVTDLIYLGIFNRRATRLKTDWTAKNPRNEMTSKELSYVAEAESLTSRLIEKDGLHPLKAANEALQRLIIPVCDR